MKRVPFLAASPAVRTKARSGDKRVRTGNERGAALVEMAMVMPLMLLILTGILAFGVALNNYVILTNAVITGSQLLAVSRGQTTDPCATVVPAIQNAAPYLTAASLTVTIVLNSTHSSLGATTCSGLAQYMVQGVPAQVTATYPCTLAIAGMNLVCNLQAQLTEVVQ